MGEGTSHHCWGVAYSGLAKRSHSCQFAVQIQVVPRPVVLVMEGEDRFHLLFAFCPALCLIAENVVRLCEKHDWCRVHLTSGF